MAFGAWRGYGTIERTEVPYEQRDPFLRLRMYPWWRRAVGSPRFVWKTYCVFRRAQASRWKSWVIATRLGIALLQVRKAASW